MVKVGEHITLDFLGVKKDYTPEFYEKVIYKIAKGVCNLKEKFEKKRVSIMLPISVTRMPS